MQDMHLALHGLAIKKHGTPAEVAAVVGLDAARVEALLTDAVARGRAVANQGKYLLTPTARMALDGEYSRYYGKLRGNAAYLAANEAFERVNVALKSLITDWQTLDIGGEKVPNDHSDEAHDGRCIDRLGALHERADKVFASLAEQLPRLQIYRDKLLVALEKAEDGAHEWVSDVRIDSYHTVWFELHEDLLRIAGRERVE